MANGLCNKAFREGFFCVRSDCHAVLPLDYMCLAEVGMFQALCVGKS